MPPPSFIATVVLAAVVLVLAIARIRSQRRLSKAAKIYKRSQHKLNTSLDDLSEAVHNFEDSNSVLVSEVSLLVSKLEQRSASSDEHNATPPFGLGCPNCGHPAYLTYQGNLNPIDSHASLLAGTRTGHLHASMLAVRWEYDEDHGSGNWEMERAAEYESTVA